MRRPMRAAAGAAGLAVASVALLGACASAETKLSAQEIAGCYYFERTPAADSLGLPWGVRLTDRPLEGWPAMAPRNPKLATTLAPGGDQDFPFGYWLVADSDSLEIGYPGGGGIVVHVAPEGQELIGSARPVGDALPPGALPGSPATRTVTLKHALCPEK